MDTKQDDQRPVDAIDDIKWGEERTDHHGYANETDRINKRGLEDWEMVERMDETSDHKIPYWFIAIFFVLLLAAIGLTFPFWGVRADDTRSWFDWGIVGGAAWVIAMGGLIYYVVDYRHRDDNKKSSVDDGNGEEKTGQPTQKK